MNRPRLDDREARALKVASKSLLLACSGGEAAGAACRLGPSHLSEASSPHNPDRFLPIDVVLQLELVSETRGVTAALARLHGCLLVPVEARGGGDLAVLLARLGREVGDVFAASARALADGRVSDLERAELAAELGDLVGVAQQAIAALRVDAAVVLPLRGRK